MSFWSTASCGWMRKAVNRDSVKYSVFIDCSGMSLKAEYCVGPNVWYNNIRGSPASWHHLMQSVLDAGSLQISSLSVWMMLRVIYSCQSPVHCIVETKAVGVSLQLYQWNSLLCRCDLRDGAISLSMPLEGPENLSTIDVDGCSHFSIWLRRNVPVTIFVRMFKHRWAAIHTSPNISNGLKIMEHVCTWCVAISLYLTILRWQLAVVLSSWPKKRKNNVKNWFT